MNLHITRQNALVIIGMMTMWSALHNQIFYPFTFTFNKTGTLPALYFYLVYVFVTASAAFLLFFGTQLKRKRDILSSRKVTLGIGIAGVIGLSLVITCHLDSPAHIAGVGIGAGLYALFVPFYFAFWSCQIASSGGNAIFNCLASYVAFCLITALRLATGLHAYAFSLVFTVLSVVLAMLVTPLPCAKNSNRPKQLRAMPLNIIIPSYIAVLFCLICIVILNPETAKFSYPPSSRAIMYLTVAVIMLALLAVCRIGRDRQYRAMLFCFSILASCSMISLVAMSFGGTISENVGNFPAIGSRIAFEAFIWTLVLANASSKHLDILLPSALYLTLVIHLPNLISGALLHTQSFPSHNGMQVLIIVGLCAIAVAVLANVLMAMFLFRPKLKSQLGAMPTDDLETALSKTQQAVGLSDRQMDIVRYAYRNWTAQRIADELFISEGTVKTHLKTIYRKASVHSKQELIDLVDNYRDK